MNEEQANMLAGIVHRRYYRKLETEIKPTTMGTFVVVLSHWDEVLQELICAVFFGEEDFQALADHAFRGASEFHFQAFHDEESIISMRRLMMYEIGDDEIARRRPRMSVQEELITCARTIAQYQRYPVLEHGLQPLEDYQVGEVTRPGLYSKLAQEQQEFAEAVEKKDELHQYHEAADLLYYAACIDAQVLLGRLYATGYTSSAPDKTFSAQIQRIIQAGLSPQKAMLAATGKYTWRSLAPGNKDERIELALIQVAITPDSQLS